MATTIQEISAYLDEDGIKHRCVDDNTIHTGFQTHTYVDRNDRNHLALVLRLDENGEFVTVFAPYVYQAPKKRAGKLFRGFAAIQYRTKMVRFEFDPRDGEIRASIELPLDDAPLTRPQVVRMVRGLVHSVEHWDPVIRKMQTGEIDLAGQPYSHGCSAVLGATGGSGTGIR